MNLKVRATIKYPNEKEDVKELEEKPWDIFPDEKSHLIQGNS